MYTNFAVSEGGKLVTAVVLIGEFSPVANRFCIEVCFRIMLQESVVVEVIFSKAKKKNINTFQFYN